MQNVEMMPIGSSLRTLTGLGSWPLFCDLQNPKTQSALRNIAENAEGVKLGLELQELPERKLMRIE